jgi:hypothetical protein
MRNSPLLPKKTPSRQSLDTSNLDVERVIVTQESSEQLFSYYITSIIYFLTRQRPFCIRPTGWDGFYNASNRNKTWTHYADSIVLAGEAANTNFLSLVLHDLPHLEWACWPVHHYKGISTFSSIWLVKR